MLTGMVLAGFCRLMRHMDAVSMGHTRMVSAFFRDRRGSET